MAPDAALADALQVSASGAGEAWRSAAPGREGAVQDHDGLDVLAAGRALAADEPLNVADDFDRGSPSGKVESIRLRLSAKARALLARVRTLRARTMVARA